LLPFALLGKGTPLLRASVPHRPDAGQVRGHDQGAPRWERPAPGRLWQVLLGGLVNTLLTVVGFILVIAVLALCAWAFVLAPFVVPRRHLHQ
jgi:hypothetical protein